MSFKERRFGFLNELKLIFILYKSGTPDHQRSIAKDSNMEVMPKPPHFIPIVYNSITAIQIELFLITEYNN